MVLYITKFVVGDVEDPKPSENSNHFDQILTSDEDLENIHYKSVDDMEANESEVNEKGKNEEYYPSED